jgi:hypothetical protein
MQIQRDVWNHLCRRSKLNIGRIMDVRRQQNEISTVDNNSLAGKPSLTAITWIIMKTETATRTLEK